ncbi:hypothetical protein CDAR_543521, partial [Caerostris darwini]
LIFRDEPHMELFSSSERPAQTERKTENDEFWRHIRDLASLCRLLRQF